MNVAEQLAADEKLIHAVAKGPHERDCELQPDVSCFCHVRVAQAAIRMLSIKPASRGSSDGSDGYDCDGRAMVTFGADGEVEIYIPPRRSTASVSPATPPRPTFQTGGFAPGNETPNNRAVSRPSEATPPPKRTCGWCNGNPIGHCAICQARPSTPETYADDPPQRTKEPVVPTELVHWNPQCEFCGKGRYCCKPGASDVQAAFEDALTSPRPAEPKPCDFHTTRGGWCEDCPRCVMGLDGPQAAQAVPVPGWFCQHRCGHPRERHSIVPLPSGGMGTTMQCPNDPLPQGFGKLQTILDMHGRGVTVDEILNEVRHRVTAGRKDAERLVKMCKAHGIYDAIESGADLDIVIAQHVAGVTARTETASSTELEALRGLYTAVSKLVAANDETRGLNRPRPDIAWRDVKQAYERMGSVTGGAT